MIGKTAKMAIAALALSCGLMVPANAQNHDNTINNIRSEVTAAAAAGRISPQSLAELTNRLHEIAGQHAAYAADGLVPQERAQLDNDLNAVSARFQSLLITAPVPSSRSWRRGGAGRNAQNLSAEIAQLRTQITQVRAELDQARTSGRINGRQVNRLQRHLDHVTRSEQQMTASGNRLTRGELNSLSRELDNVRRGINHYSR